MNLLSLSGRIREAERHVRETLLAARTPQGHWSGRLSTSPLATATAVVALELAGRSLADAGDQPFHELVRGGTRFLLRHQLADGSWGDTTKSLGNIATTMLAEAALHLVSPGEHVQACERARRSIDRAGGVPALFARYGRDRTFSAPILTHCALCGRIDWPQVVPLPFELACLSPSFYRHVRLSVVSYALPALIAIGQVRHVHAPPANRCVRWIRDLARARSLAVLERIQPQGGGFLEAAPLTSFVAMSLASIGQARHPVTTRCLDFLVRSVRPDGSWPIDTNLATWVSTLAASALGDDLPEESRGPLADWLLAQQFRRRHLYTEAEPGGWAWTDLSGGVPDADDTAGALLALERLGPPTPEVRAARLAGARWLLRIQNRDGGWPTFCRGWGRLPFDRSAPDLTAHAIRALSACELRLPAAWARAIRRARRRGLNYLERAQRPDGSWLPLWFGNQHTEGEVNPVYGTSRVLAAYRDLRLLESPAARRGLDWLASAQAPDGGWGGGPGSPSSVEETALAVEILASAPTAASSRSLETGLAWLLDRVEQSTFQAPSPIGLYFARLWYFEDLYPIIFTLAALRAARSARS